MNPPTPAQPRSRSTPREVYVILTLAVAVLAIYGQTLGHPFISFDDPGYVYENLHVRAGLRWAGVGWAFTTFQQSNWHPLTWLSLMLDAWLYGLHAGGYHLTNLLLHGANTLLLYRWLRRTTGALWPSALTAFFFAAHPLHVESVAWVTERKDVLSTLFFLLTLLAYSRYARGAEKRWRYYWLAWGCYALGLLAKPMLVTLPPLLLLVDFWPLRRIEPGTWRGRWWRLLAEKIPFGVLMAASCVVTFLAQRTQAVVPLDALPPTFRAASAMLGCGEYLVKTAWPVALGIYYPYWYGVPVWLPLAWGVVLAAITAVAVLRWRRQPYLAVGWLWFLGTLVPVIGLVQVGGQAIADRYMYLPHIGLFIAVFWSGRAAWHQWPRLRPWLGGAAAAAAAACLGLSIRQASFWQSSATLFEHTIAVAEHPTSRLYHLYGDALAGIPGREADAERAYLHSWQVHPDFRNQDAALSLSVMWLQQKRWAEVVDLLTPLSENHAADRGVLNNLAFALLRTGEEERALALYRRCAEQYPDYALGRFGLADCLRARGDVEGACEEYEAGLVHQPDWMPALNFLAWTYAHLDEPAAHRRALELARRAVEAGRGQEVGSYNVLAAADAAAGDWPQAVMAARNALALAARPGVPRETAAACQTRLDAYLQGRLP